MTRRALTCAALVLGILNSPAFAQNANISPSGNYSATLSCAGGGANSGLLQLWSASHEVLPTIEMSCEQSYEIASGAATMFYLLRVYDPAGKLVKNCESPAVKPVKEGRFSCKGGGKMSATLSVQAR